MNNNPFAKKFDNLVSQLHLMQSKKLSDDILVGLDQISFSNDNYNYTNQKNKKIRRDSAMRNDKEKKHRDSIKKGKSEFKEMHLKSKSKSKNIKKKEKREKDGKKKKNSD